MLNEVGLSDGFWKEAIGIAIYILNIGHIRVNNDKTPYELWNGRLVRVIHPNYKVGCNPFPYTFPLTLEHQHVISYISTLAKIYETNSPYDLDYCCELALLALPIISPYLGQTQTR